MNIVGLNDNEFSSPLVKIFPNPSMDKITITTESKLTILEITLRTLDGRRLLSRQPAQGVYIVEVRTAESLWFGKVVVE